MNALERHFDKVILFILFISLVVIWETVLFKIGHFSTSWLENVAGQVLAALLTLMVGNKTGARSTDGGTNAKTEIPAPDPSAPDPNRVP